MPAYTAKPDGSGKALRVIGWCEASHPTCPKGHMQYGCHIGGTTFHTCQAKTPSGKTCGEHMLIVSVLDGCIVVRLSKAEFEQARKDWRLGSELRADLMALVRASIATLSRN